MCAGPNVETFGYYRHPSGMNYGILVALDRNVRAQSDVAEDFAPNSSTVAVNEKFGDNLRKSARRPPRNWSSARATSQARYYFNASSRSRVRTSRA